MVHQCIRIIGVGSFLKGDITSDRNKVSNWFRSNKDGAELFSMIVHKNLSFKQRKMNNFSYR